MNWWEDPQTDSKPPTSHVNVELSHYSKDGKPYRRISRVAKEAAAYFEPDGEQRLQEWQDGIRSKYPDPAEAYLQALAKAGTQLHNMLECEAKNGIGIVQAIEEKLGKIESTEQVVYDDDLMIAGKYDANFESAGGDYKSAAKARLSHKIQVSFYCHNSGKEVGYVICNLGGNKQGFTLTKVDVEKYYGMLKEYLTT